MDPFVGTHGGSAGILVVHDPDRDVAPTGGRTERSGREPNTKISQAGLGGEERGR